MAVLSLMASGGFVVVTVSNVPLLQRTRAHPCFPFLLVLT